MNRASWLALLAALFVLFVAAKESWAVWAEVAAQRGLTLEHEMAMTRNDDLTRRASAILETTQTESMATGFSPAVILEEAKKSGLDVLTVEATERGVRLQMAGRLPAAMSMVKDNVSAVRILPDQPVGRVRMEAVYVSQERPALDTPEAIEKHLATLEQSPGATTEILRGDLTKSFLWSSTRSLPALQQPVAPPTLGLTYLGTMRGGGGKLSGVFREAGSGLVISAAAGERIGIWRVARIEEEQAVLAPTDGGGRNIVVARGSH